MNGTGDIARRAREALWMGFRKTSAAQVDAKGYVSGPEENLLPGVDLDAFAGDLQQGGGSELKPRARNGRPMKPKFLAVHSSCAMAVNAFGPLKRRTSPWDWPDLAISGLRAPRFEAKLPTGIHRSQANLDVLFETADAIVGIESKLTEYLAPKTPHFAKAFVREKLDVEPCWWEMIERHRDAVAPPKKLLDEAQLIKHYLGLRRAVGPAGEHRGRSATLLYLFWEPRDAAAFPLFARHRAEVEELESAVSGSSVRFRWRTYESLWSDWERRGMLTRHVANFRRRYGVSIEA